MPLNRVNNSHSVNSSLSCNRNNVINFTIILQIQDFLQDFTFWGGGVEGLLGGGGGSSLGRLGVKNKVSTNFFFFGGGGGGGAGE